MPRVDVANMGKPHQSWRQNQPDLSSNGLMSCWSSCIRSLGNPSAWTQRASLPCCGGAQQRAEPLPLIPEDWRIKSCLMVIRSPAVGRTSCTLAPWLIYDGFWWLGWRTSAFSDDAPSCWPRALLNIWPQP